MPRLSDLIGKKFGRLVVQNWIPTDTTPGRWLCLCDCGNIKYTYTSHLKNDNVKSCGCLLSDKKIHNGLSSTREFSSWHSMHLRCYGTADQAYKEKARRVCERWHGQQGFLNFLQDMGPRPEGTTLERINNSKGYYPENCKWDTLGRQAYNRDMFKNNTTTKTGVSYLKDSEKWRARISFCGKIINLGTFDTFEAAVESRSVAEIKYYGKNKE